MQPADPGGARSPVIRVSLAVRGTQTRFTVEVQAESITQAVSLTIDRHPGCDIKVLFPIDPEAFFAAGDERTSATMRLEAGRHGTLRGPRRRNRSLTV